MPNNDAITFPVKSDFPSSALRVFSGEKYVLSTPTIKMINTNSNITLGTSYIKK
jgi:hypothetical protein